MFALAAATYPREEKSSHQGLEAPVDSHFTVLSILSSLQTLLMYFRVRFTEVSAICLGTILIEKSLLTTEVSFFGHKHSSVSPNHMEGNRQNDISNFTWSHFCLNSGKFCLQITNINIIKNTERHVCNRLVL